MNRVSGGHGGSICLVTNDLDYVVRNSGIGTHFSLLAPLLARAGWRVHVLYLGWVDDPEAMARAPRLLAREGIGFTALADLDPPAHLRAGVIHAPSFVTTAAKVRYALEELHRVHHFDLVEFPDWLGFGFCSVQARRSGRFLDGARLMVKLHGTSAWQREGNRRWPERTDEILADYCERYAFEHCDVQLSPSRWMLDYVRDAGWAVRDSAVVAYPYPERTHQVAGGDQAPRELVFFGRLEVRKGLDIFAEALDGLDPALPVTFLGRDTPLPGGEMATAYIARRFHGRPVKVLAEYNREQAMDYLAEGGRLAVIASRSETFGFTVAECAVNGIPFIAARTGGIPEVVGDPEINEQILFRPTAAELGGRIKQYLATDPDELRALRRRVQRAVDPESRNDQVAEAYAGVLDDRARASGRLILALPEQERLAATGTHGPALARGPERPATTLSPAEAPADDTVTLPARARPLVTVAVTYYNLPDYLPETLAGLAGQTYPELEVIVVDDGSTGAVSVRVFEEQQRLYPQFRFLSQPNAGPGCARNRALAGATGEYFITVDADNIPRPDMVERFVEGMLRHAGCSALTCHVAAFRAPDDIDQGRFEFLYIPTGGPRAAACFLNVYGDTNAIFKTDDLRAVGGYETDRYAIEDWETFTKIAGAGHAVDVIPEPLFYYRLRGDNRSVVNTKSYTDTYPFANQVMKKFFVGGGAGGLSRAEATTLWQCVAGFDALARHRCHLEWKVTHLEALLRESQRVREVAHEQHAYIESLHIQKRFLRYRAADKCVNALKRLPLLHAGTKFSLPVAWKAWKVCKKVSPMRLVRRLRKRQAA
jgi:glycosyltransferase involved in cell wall biosynthesis